jgi:dTDP-4-amino-4,6-dideoxygalactose transaminase
VKKIPLIRPDLPRFKEVEIAFREVLENGRVTNFGKYVTQFEQEASRYLDTSTVTVSSGTLGLLFILQAIGLKPGQKVILPSFTFMATAQAVLYARGIPLFAEVGQDGNLDPNDVGNLLNTQEVFAVLGVHLYGLPCHVEALQAVVDRASSRQGRKIHLLFDAAHAFGSARNGRRVGGFGEAETFSLSVTKALVSVEGGLVSSRNQELIERIRRMRNYGIEQNYDAWWPGLNGKMSEFHAIVGLYNLRRLDALLAERQRKAHYYLDQIRQRTNFQPISLPKDVIHTFKDVTVLVPEALVARRQEVMTFLGERGIETRAYFYPPVHEQRFFQRFADRPLPRTEALARRVLTLPFFTSITESEMDYVVDALVEAEKALGAGTLR